MPRIGRHFMPNMSRAAWGFMQSGDFPVPVLYLKFGEGSGNALKDSSPKGNDGTNRNALWVKGYLGPGLYFDGLDDSVLVEDAASLRITDAITVLCRFKPAVVDQDAYPMHKTKYRMKIINNKLQCYLHIGGALKSTISTAVLGTDWVHGGFTYDKDDGTDKVKLYIGGAEASYTVQADTEGEPIEDSTGIDMFIGYFSITTYQFKGIIDELLIWDEALTAAQIRQRYQGYR